VTGWPTGGRGAAARPHELTRKVAGAEAERLAGLVQLARASGVIPRKA
jgi:hypothetical protein